MGDAVLEAAVVPPLVRSRCRCFLDVKESSRAELDGWKMSSFFIFDVSSPLDVAAVDDNEDDAAISTCVLSLTFD
jgi:hypothetical protein